MKIINNIKTIVLAFIIKWLLQILFKLNKIVIQGENHLQNLINSKKPIMVCVWHGRLLFPCWYIRQKTTNLYAIAGKHNDAEIMAQILNGWGYGLIRGSTRKGGKAVVQKMEEIFQNAGIIAVTNDGPKGPARIAKAGSTRIAIKHNVQIITVTGSATSYWQINSWDKFMLPRPFGKIHLIVSPPLEITNKLKTADEEIQILSDFLNLYQDEADKQTSKL